MIPDGYDLRPNRDRVVVVAGPYRGRRGRCVDPPLPVRHPCMDEDQEASDAELLQRQEEYFLTKYGTGYWIDLFQEGDPKTADIFGREVNVRGLYIRYFARDELELI